MTVMNSNMLRAVLSYLQQLFNTFRIRQIVQYQGTLHIIIKLFQYYHFINRSLKNLRINNHQNFDHHQCCVQSDNYQNL